MPAKQTVTLTKLGNGDLVFRLYIGDTSNSIDQVIYIPQANLAALSLVCSLSANVETGVVVTKQLGSPGQDHTYQPGAMSPQNLA